MMSLVLFFYLILHTEGGWQIAFIIAAILDVLLAAVNYYNKK